MDMVGFIRVPWYELYTGMLYEPCRVSRRAQGGTVQAGSVVLPLLLFCIVAFGMRLWLFSEPAVIHEMLEGQRSEYVSAGEREAAETRQEAIELALRTPGIPVLMALHILLRNVGALLATLLLLLLLLLTAAGRWDRVARLLESACMATSILTVGLVIETLAMLLTRRLAPPLSLAAFVQAYDGRSIVHYLAAKADFFSFWYLAVLGVTAAVTLRGPITLTLPLVFAGWMLLVLGSYLCGVEYMLAAG